MVIKKYIENLALKFWNRCSKAPFCKIYRTCEQWLLHNHGMKNCSPFSLDAFLSGNKIAIWYKICEESCSGATSGKKYSFAQFVHILKPCDHLSDFKWQYLVL